MVLKGAKGKVKKGIVKSTKEKKKEGIFGKSTKHTVGKSNKDMDMKKPLY